MARTSRPRGDLVHLRLLGAADRDPFLAAVKRSRRLHHPWTQPPATPEAYDEYVKRSPARRVFGVFRNDDDALAGVVGLSQIFHGRFGNAYLGYYAFTPHAGKGYLREAICLVTRHGFETLGLHRIQASIQPGNARSIALIQCVRVPPRGSVASLPRRRRRVARPPDLGPPRGRSARGRGHRLERATSPCTASPRGTGARCREVRVRRDQSRFVGDVAGYLALCRYGRRLVAARDPRGRRDGRVRDVGAGPRRPGLVLDRRVPDRPPAPAQGLRPGGAGCVRRVPAVHARMPRHRAVLPARQRGRGAALRGGGPAPRPARPRATRWSPGSPSLHGAPGAGPRTEVWSNGPWK